MKQWKMGTLAAGALATVVLLGNPSDASATLDNFNGYACNVSMVSTDSGGGPSGTLYSQPGCTGTYLGYAYLWSSNGNTHPEQMDRLLQGFLTATGTGVRVYGTWNTFNFFGSTIHYIQSLSVTAD